MVKNDAGGNKGKGLARKHVNAAKCGGSKQLRVATDEAERYAVVSKMLGNGMCYVRLLSGGNGTGDMLCIIRNKFKGRGKRDNILDSGSWVLVGLREWASKQDTCDLLEVYNDGERERLMKNEPCFKGVAAANEGSSVNSSSSINNSSSGNINNSSRGNINNSSSVNSNSGSRVQFTDSTTMKYSKLLGSENKGNEGNDDESDEESDDLMQQRNYDMPSDSSDDESDEPDEPAVDTAFVPVSIIATKMKTKTNRAVNVDDI
jgi:translation initiation factor IF-1